MTVNDIIVVILCAIGVFIFSFLVCFAIAYFAAKIDEMRNYYAGNDLKPTGKHR